MGCGGECACLDLIPSKSLYRSMDISRISCINERERGSCLRVIESSVIDRREVAYSKDSLGIVVKIPFTCKVALSKIEIRTSFTLLEVFTNNQYVTLSYKPKKKEEYNLPGTDHVIRVVLPAYKHKSVDTLTIRLTGAETGALSYLCVYGIVSGVLPKAVHASYEVYGLPEENKGVSREEKERSRIGRE